MKSKTKSSKILALVLSLCMIITMMPVQSFAEVKASSILDVITEDMVFDAVKGENTSKDNVTKDLKGINGFGDKFYAYANPDTNEVTFKTSRWGNPQANIELTWKGSSHEDIIIAKSDMNALKLLQKPALDTNVKLTLGLKEISGGATKDLVLNLVVKGENEAESPDVINLFKEAEKVLKGDNTSLDAVSKNISWPKTMTWKTAFVKDEGNTYIAKCDIEGTTVTYKNGDSVYKMELTPDASEAYKFDAEGIKVKVAAEPVKVGVNVVIRDTASKRVLKEKKVTVTVADSSAPAEKNILDCITSDLIFDAIKGENKAKDDITKPLVNPAGTNYITDFYAKIAEDGSFTSWFGGAYGSKAHIVFKSIEPAGILELNKASEKTIDLKAIPEKDTVVNIVFTVSEKGNSKNTKDVTVPVTVKAAKKASVLDEITDEMLFDVIKGENTDKDNITKPFVLNEKTNGNNPFYYKGLDSAGQPQWWGGIYGATAIIEIKSSSNTDVIKVGTEAPVITIPKEDTEVTLTFELVEKSNKSNKQTRNIKVLLKGNPSGGGDTPAADPNVDILYNEVLSVLKGTNESAELIKKDIEWPMRTSNMRAYKESSEVSGRYDAYADVTDGKLEYKSTFGLAPSYRIEIMQTPVSTAVKLDQTGIKVNRTSEDQTATFNVKIIDNKNGQKLLKEENVVLTVKAMSAVEKELTDLLEKYLGKDVIADNLIYTTYAKDGVTFREDYISEQVKYSFKLPNIASEEGYGWGEIKTTVTSSNGAEDVKKVNNYVWDPVRNNVGGEKKTINLTYTMEKDGVSVSKDIKVKVPALTQQEIDEEISLLEQVKANFFDGIKGENIDKDNVISNLFAVKEVRIENGKLVWNNDSNDNKYYGFRFPSQSSWDIKESVDFIDSLVTDVAFSKRPAEDTVITLSHSLESVQLQKYVDLYKSNESLQKLKDITLSTQVTVKKVDAGCKKLTIGSDVINAPVNGNAYSVLLDKAVEKINVAADLNVLGAKLLVDGADCTKAGNGDVTLENGFKKFGVTVEDKDKKDPETLQTNTYTISVVSKDSLEAGIKALPDDPAKAKEKELEAATDLFTQFSLLTADQKAEIAGKDKIAKYENYVGTPEEVAGKQLAVAEKDLFKGIRGQNPSSDMVYTDLVKMNYAKVEGDKVTFYENSVEGCNVKIDWIKSTAPEYVDVKDGTDFGSRYVEAFNLNQRPERNTPAKDITFTAKLSHLIEGDVTKDTSVNFTLREYNAELDELNITGVSGLEFKHNKYDYNVTKAGKNAELVFSTVIPGAKVTVNGEAVKDGKATVKLDKDINVITIKVNDEIRNTLNEKWDEKVYTITVTTSVDKIEAAMNALPAAKDITVENYTQYEKTVADLNQAFNSLTEAKKNEISKEAKDKLNAAVEKIAEIELRVAKDNAISDLNRHCNKKDDYVAENWEKIEAIRAEGRKAIENAKDAEEISMALTDAKAKITQIPAKDNSETGKDASLKKIVVLPGGETAVKGEDGVYTVKLPEGTDTVRIKVQPENPKATVKFGDTQEVGVSEDYTFEAMTLPEGESVLKFTVVSSNKEVTAEYTLRVERDAKAPVDPEKVVKVSFELVGDTHHAENAHTAFQTWIEKTTIEVPANSTLKYVTDKMFIENNIKYTMLSNGSYISSINGLAEFDNGPNSGWMYNVNGKKIDLTYDKYTVQNGDEIKWFYTDDYTKEKQSDEYYKAEAEKVDQLIAAIGKVTLEKADQIEEARTAYEGLAKESKDQVKNLKVLVAAEKALADLQKPVVPTDKFNDVKKAHSETASSLSGLTMGYGSEWVVVGLTRGNVKLSDSSADRYYQSVVQTLKANNGVLSNNKYTEYSRTILALTALGYDASDIAGYNLVAKLGDFNKVTRQGVNGSVWALIALDSNNYELPAGATTTRAKLISEILGAQSADGIWVMGAGASVDMTAMAIQALAPYYNKDADVKAAVDSALVALSGIQTPAGSFRGDGGKPSAESTAQVIIALSSLGIDVQSDARFVKNGVSAIDGLMSFYVGNGSFEHNKGLGADAMATEQALCAMTSYMRLRSGSTSIYNMTDIEKKENPEEPETVLPVIGNKGNATITTDKTNAQVAPSEIAGLKNELTVKLADKKVSYDKKAIEAIKKQIPADALEVEFVLEKVEKGYSDKQADTIKKNNSLGVFSVKLVVTKADGKEFEIHDFNGGKATVTVPFANPRNVKLEVYRVENNGTLTLMESSYNNGMLTWVTDGHSYYMVAEAGTVKTEDVNAPKTGDTENMLPWVLLLLGTAGTVVAVRRKKEQ